MSEFNYLEQKARYLNSIGRTGAYCDDIKCNDCMLGGINNGTAYGCNMFEFKQPEEATELIRQWAEKHPVITNADKFKQVFGLDAPKVILPSAVGLRNKWWNEEYKNPKRSDESK